MNELHVLVVIACTGIQTVTW